MGRQFGQFFLLIGVLSFMVFGISVYAGQTVFWLFFVGLVLVLLGGRLALANRSESEPTGRFRLLRRMFRRKSSDE